MAASEYSLRSDFVDWYDSAFAGRHDARAIPFCRWSRTIRTRQDDLGSLRRAGLLVPRSGSAISFNPDARVIHYLDGQAHRGEGKAVCFARDVPPDDFVAHYVDPPAGQRGSVSVRLLVVGGTRWWFQYTSDDAWRSNVGNVCVTMLPSNYAEIVWRWAEVWTPLAAFLLGYALCAVDFVVGQAGTGIAVDLNTAPGLEPLRGHMTGREIYAQIRGALDRGARGGPAGLGKEHDLAPQDE